MIKNITNLFSHNNPLLHYFHHFLIANVGLFLAYIIFGSITIWEVVFFFFMAFFPAVDEFFYAVLHYLNEEIFREIIHLFIGSEYEKTLSLLHAKRLSCSQLILHNVVLYLALWSVMFVFLMLNMPLAFYGLAGLLTHLMQDIANDQYEYLSLRNWLWPIHFLGLNY